MLKLTALAMTLLLASCAPTATPRTAVDRELANVANPSAVIATELAFARTAREKGQWTAFREYAAEGAVMFVPEAVKAQEWLRGRADPAQAVQWQPHQVWMSCDGSLAVSRGAAQWPDGRHGDFLTVWQRQRDGSYRWTVDVGQFRPDALPAPEFVKTEVAQCRPQPPAQSNLSEIAPVARGQSDDGTLRYHIVQPSNGVVVRAVLWDGQAFGTQIVAPFVLR